MRLRCRCDCCSGRNELGQTVLHEELEKEARPRPVSTPTSHIEPTSAFALFGALFCSPELNVVVGSLSELLFLIRR